VILESESEIRPLPVIKEFTRSGLLVIGWDQEMKRISSSGLEESQVLMIGRQLELVEL
jgi:hypothetical protein